MSKSAPQHHAAGQRNSRLIRLTALLRRPAVALLLIIAGVFAMTAVCLTHRDPSFFRVIDYPRWGYYNDPLMSGYSVIWNRT